MLDQSLAGHPYSAFMNR